MHLLSTADWLASNTPTLSMHRSMCRQHQMTILVYVQDVTTSLSINMFKMYMSSPQGLQFVTPIVQDSFLQIYTPHPSSFKNQSIHQHEFFQHSTQSMFATSPCKSLSLSLKRMDFNIIIQLEVSKTTQSRVLLHQHHQQSHKRKRYSHRSSSHFNMQQVTPTIPCMSTNT
jgi:hypothetical protein